MSRSSAALTVFAALAIALAAACAARTETIPTTTHPKVATEPPSAEVLGDLAMIAVGSPLAEGAAESERQRILRGESTLNAFVDRLLEDPRFARDVAPEVLFNKHAIDVAEEEAWETLRLHTTPAGAVYYLRKPCDVAKSVRVHPWWAMDTEVNVCPDAYQPSHLKEDKTGWFCSGDNLDKDRSTFCGCGPNLMSCARDEDNGLEMRRALKDEVKDTVAWVVNHDQPLARVFTTNETVRTRYAELFYQRWRVIGGLAQSVGDINTWARDEKPAPRPEAIVGQHAGVLTTPHMLLFGDTPRARMRNMFSYLWCASPSSINVTTADVLNLGVTDLRDGDGWKQLAKMPICTDCHARLDYGMQFFLGYPSSFVGVVFDVGRQPKGSGNVYGHDITDLRGEADLSPRGFASVAVKQPEFFRCMAKDVTEHVWNDDATADDREAVARALRETGTMRAMMKEALVRYARRASRTGPRARDAGGRDDASTTLADGRIVLGHALRSRVDASCKHCHSDGARGFLGDEAIARDAVEKMLVEVAFKGMPKLPTTLDAQERRSLVRGLVFALWTDGSTRGEALRYFESAMATSPVHRGSALTRLVEARAGARDEEAATWTFSDEARHDTTMYTPSFAITFAYVALRVCKAAGHTDALLDECLKRVAGGDAALKGH